MSADRAPSLDASLHTDEIVQALRRELRQQAATAGAPEAVSRPGLDQKAAPAAGLRQLLQDMERRWVLTPRPFVSRLPFVARFRTLWNEVSTRWYVQPLLEQQQEFNASVLRLCRQMAGVLSALESEARYVWTDAAPYDRLAVTLGRTTAQLELVLRRLEERLRTLEEANRAAEMAELRGRLARLEAVIQEQGNSGTEGGFPFPQSAVLSPESSPPFDYFGFELRFRGAPEEVQERQRPYLPYFEGAPGPVLDLGCGRGEFVALLKEAGIAARGVDGDATMAAYCRERGLDVAQGDLLEYLAAQPDGSLGGVASIQVVEHLPPPAIVQLVHLALRKLAPGGVFLAETINPMCVLALAGNYTMDLNHSQPVHPNTLAFLTESAGFTDVEVRYTSPVPEMAQLQLVPADPDGAPNELAAILNANLQRLNGLLFGYQDYAVIARKPR